MGEAQYSVDTIILFLARCRAQGSKLVSTPLVHLCLQGLAFASPRVLTQRSWANQRQNSEMEVKSPDS